MFDQAQWQRSALASLAILACVFDVQAFSQTPKPAGPTAVPPPGASLATTPPPPPSPALQPVPYQFYPRSYPGDWPGIWPYSRTAASPIPNAFSPIPFAASPLNTQNEIAYTAYGPAAHTQSQYTFVPMNARATGAYSVSPAGWRPTPAQPYPPGYLTDPYLPLPAANVTPNAPLTQGVIHVFLPTADAAVYLNGQKMRGTGTERAHQPGPAVQRGIPVLGECDLRPRRPNPSRIPQGRLGSWRIRDCRLHKVSPGKPDQPSPRPR